MTSPQHHRIDYVELTVDDLPAATAFYGAAFGWKFTQYGPGYVGIQGPGEREVGGIEVGDRPRAGGPLVILYSDDLDATLGAVATAGGTILQQPYSFPGGRRFNFSDPAGNELAVWSAPAAGKAQA